MNGWFFSGQICRDASNKGQLRNIHRHNITLSAKMDPLNELCIDGATIKKTTERVECHVCVNVERTYTICSKYFLEELMSKQL